MMNKWALHQICVAISYFFWAIKRACDFDARWWTAIEVDSGLEFFLPLVNIV